MFASGLVLLLSIEVKLLILLTEKEERKLKEKMASEQSSPEINADNLNSSAADVHVQPPGEKEWSDGFYDKEVINGNTPDAPKRGF